VVVAQVGSYPVEVVVFFVEGAGWGLLARRALIDNFGNWREAVLENIFLFVFEVVEFLLFVTIQLHATGSVDIFELSRAGSR
jgi:hypothetical protein